MVNSWGLNWDCFDAPSQILCNFVFRVDNKKHNVNIIYCMTTIKEYVCCYSVKIFKTNPEKNTNPGGGGGKQPVLDPALTPAN